MYFSKKHTKMEHQKNFEKLFNGIIKHRLKKANSVNSYFHWCGFEDFKNNFLSGEGPFEFMYKDMIISLGGEDFGNKFSLANKDEVLDEKEYSSTPEMLDSLRVDGKSLKEIWDDLR